MRFRSILRAIVPPVAGLFALSSAIALQGFYREYARQVAQNIIGDLAPRPLLVVFGKSDTTVPPAMSRALFESAKQPKRLLAIAGAGHRDYALLGQQAYAECLTAFFVDALLKPRGALPSPDP